MIDFQRILDRVPDYPNFLSVAQMDESTLRLQQEYPDLVEVRIIGHSRQNHPIYCLKIGAGELNALMFGCPHPNEPMGAMMIEYFARALCEDDAFRLESGYTWYLIKCIDPDGTKLNEGWFKGPFNLTNYARNFFRPTAKEQVEWTFPIDYKELHFHDPLPETQALMDLMAEIQPDFLYSLHNAGFGGAYWYLSEDLPELYERFYHAAKSRNMPLALGEPEAPYIKEYAPAVFENGGIQDDYDFVEQFGTPGIDMASRFECGTGSGDYARQYGTVSLIAELPYYYSAKIESDKLMEFTRREAAIKSETKSYENYEEIRSYYALYQDVVSEDNPFAKMLDMMLKDNQSVFEEHVAHIKADEQYNVPCKESEAFDSLEVSDFYALLSWGLLLRGAEFECNRHKGDIAQRLKECVNTIEQVMMAKAEAVEAIDYSLVPIQTLVRIQLESGLLVSGHIKDRKEKKGK